jgi:hypothetical protein
MLPEGGLAALVGAPGVGKTVVAVDLMMRVSLGMPVFGRTTKAGPVVMIAAEGANGVKARVEAWKDVNHVQSVDNIFFLTEPVQLVQERETGGLLNAIALRGIRPTLVIVDTLARCFEGGDENSAEAMGRLIGAAGRISKQTGATVLFNHHTRKSGDVERGSSAFRGALDAMIKIAEEDKAVIVSCEKMKDAASFEPFRLQRRSVGNSCILEYAGEAGVASQSFQLGAGEEHLLVELLGGPKSVAQLSIDLPTSESNVRRWAKRLASLELITRQFDGPYAITALGQEAVDVPPVDADDYERHHDQLPSDDDGGDNESCLL